MPASTDRPFFLPAATPAEAIARIYSLTGAHERGTRGEKGAVLALRNALGLDLDVARTNAVMGARIAQALDVEWVPAKHAERNKVSLDGLNLLLEAATDAFYDGSLRQLARQRPAALSGPQWAAFKPAQSKIEAVNRISALTRSGPEDLGPGSKERKRVLMNLAAHLEPGLSTRLSKTRLSEALAARLHAPWTDACESTGETISLAGLNTLLAGAERRLGLLGAGSATVFGTPEDEGSALAAALVDGWTAERQSDGRRRVHWDGKKSIGWMVDQGLTRGPNDNEWQGFYFEAKGREILSAAFTPNPTPPRTTYENTPFDYSLHYVWDLKAHTEAWLLPRSGGTKPGQSSAPLNDQLAMEACIEDQGLGFLMVSGHAVADEDGSFVAWHREFKRARKVKSKPSNSGNSRIRKVAFEPLHVEAFWFPNSLALHAAKASGQLTGFQDGFSQAPDEEGGQGSPRRPKYSLSTPKARKSSSLVARYDFPRDDRPAEPGP